MIANLSRLAQFNECRVKAKFWDVDRIMPLREATPLMLGESVHKGFETLFATGDANTAVKEAEVVYRKRLVGQALLPEEKLEEERNITFSKLAIGAYSDVYAHEDFKVLMPEVEFTIPMPNTTHHCHFIHNILHPGESWDMRAGVSTCPDQRCMHPHYFQGKTDAVISWKNRIWLLEHKTSAMTGDSFYNRFYMDPQPTGYLYGIWKATGMLPHGFLLNVIKKPTKQFKGTIQEFFARGAFEREPYLRTEADLMSFERDFILQATEYEEAFRDNKLFHNKKACTSWNRKCYYWNLCINHEQPSDRPDEFRQRKFDYVNKKYFELLGIPNPEPEDTESDPEVNPDEIGIVN